MFVIIVSISWNEHVDQFHVNNSFKNIKMQFNALIKTATDVNDLAKRIVSTTGVKCPFNPIRIISVFTCTTSIILIINYIYRLFMLVTTIYMLYIAKSLSRRMKSCLLSIWSNINVVLCWLFSSVYSRTFLIIVT